MLAAVKKRPKLHQQTDERPSSGHETPAPQIENSARYCLSEMWLGEETADHAIEECLQINHIVIQAPEPYLIVTEPTRPGSCGSCVKQKLTFQEFYNRVNLTNPSVQLFAQQQQHWMW